ncbi:hypothetical protein B484DRAFT_428706 [Ochromonadaceae sp. CCMP2298]|nr:hypothetical protein B484DRAFT_428706 [Ochromonadaceae sp. CCMP2298]
MSSMRGLDGELVSVEGLVLQKCYQADPDELGGVAGWQGWHTEGMLLRCLFGLLLWEVLFTCPTCPTCPCTGTVDASASGATADTASASASVQTQTEDNDNTNSINNTKKHSNTRSHPTYGNTYCVFVTPFQDAPLDLGLSSFYPSRRREIEMRLRIIGGMDAGGLIRELGETYRLHHNQQCRGVNWDVPLKVLQVC